MSLFYALSIPTFPSLEAASLTVQPHTTAAASVGWKPLDITKMVPVDVRDLMMQHADTCYFTSSVMKYC